MTASNTFKRTKIIATIASSASAAFLKQLVQAGTDIFRLNTAHMSLDDAQVMTKNIRAAAPDAAILIDTKGPEVRTVLNGAPLSVKKGDKVRLVKTLAPEQDTVFSVNYADFVSDIACNHRVLIDDAELALRVVEKSETELVLEAENDGVIANHKSVNVPDAQLHLESLSARDRMFINFAIENELDFIAHSFVRSRGDVESVQALLDAKHSPIKIIAKIENRQGVDNLHAILTLAAGAMVARGDLGVEIPGEEVPSVQKRIIYECMSRRKFVITATQMLQSMIVNPRPTRAEISDIANAVLDGSDAVMLSGETAQGKYPVESVDMMRRVIEQTQLHSVDLITRPQRVSGELLDEGLWHTVQATMSVADHLDVRAIVCNTMSGNLARLCAAYRSKTPIYAMSYEPATLRQMRLLYGVESFFTPYNDNPLQLIRDSLSALLEKGKLAPDDRIIVVGNFSGKNRGVNYMQISTPRAILRAAEQGDVERAVLE